MHFFIFRNLILKKPQVIMAVLSFGFDQMNCRNTIKKERGKFGSRHGKILVDRL